MSQEGKESKRPRLVPVENPYVKKPPPPFEASSTTAISLPDTHQELEAPQDSKAETTPVPSQAAASKPSDTCGDKESAEERLPSHNISFESAEVLTVHELHKHAALYMDQSVRITGVVIHRHVTNEAAVVLVLGDPLLAPHEETKLPAALRAIKRGLVSKPVEPKPKDPVDVILNTLSQQPTVLVLSKSAEVAFNDLAMVLGEVRTSSDNFQNSPYVDARIVRNVNGTDMRLANEALALRRQHLLETHEEREGLLAGCGPPPYFVQEQKPASA